jgi:AcrR family transcriptional regulator
MRPSDPKVRAALLKAAQEQFAQRGYAGTSVQDIVDAAKVTKPVLYSYFESKAGIYKAIVDFAYDECHRLMQEAVQHAPTLEKQLVEILTVLFEFLRERRDLSRIAFATAFAAPGELPENLDHQVKGRRNFELVHSQVQEARNAGRLDPSFDSLELAYGIYGALTFHLMANVLEPDAAVSRKTAERIVRLFLKGAESK